MSITSQRAGTDTGHASPIAKWLPLAVVLCGTFAFVLDFFVVNVALPDIQHSLRASTAAIEWLVSGYALSSASLLVCGGRLGDHYGRRRWFSVGLAAFVVASALCALATDPAFLIAARLVQGAGGAIMAPNVLAIVGVTYTGRDRVRAISVYGTVMGLAAVGGQLLGGLLIEANVAGLGWRAIFWINVPVGIAALVLAPRLVPESRAEHGGRLDLPGAALLGAALVALVLPLVDGRQRGWPAWSWACLAASPVLLTVFAAYLRRTQRAGRKPLLDPAIFAVPAFRAGLTVQVLFWCQQAASYLLLAVFLQEGRGLSPLASGGTFAVLAAGYLVTSFRAPGLVVRFGRRVIATGAVIGAVGYGVLLLAVSHWGTGGPLAALFPGLFLLGAGQGLCITPLTTTVLSHADARTAGSVSGALATAQQIGNAIGVAVSGVIFYGALSHGFAPAFGFSLVQLGCLLLGVASLSLALIRPTAVAPRSMAPAPQSPAAPATKKG
jgi:EmrB/QacA subfamily drug resistance transporter